MKEGCGSHGFVCVKTPATRQCVALWFGSLEAFEEYIRSKVCDAVVHDLRSKVFTKTWTLQVSTPVLWGFMDLVATFIRIGWWDTWFASYSADFFFVSYTVSYYLYIIVFLFAYFIFVSINTFSHYLFKYVQTFAG